jgi:ERCC4-type nuclease
MFDVIIDTREQQPWQFTSSQINNIEHTKLDTGDYSIKGLEHLLCIERKKSVAELAGNITADRFKNELLRMSTFKYKFLLLEFDYGDIDMYPENSGLPKYAMSKVRVKGPFIMKFLSEIQVKYGIHVVCCKNAQYASYIATNIMKQVDEIENGTSN